MVAIHAALFSLSGKGHACRVRVQLSELVNCCQGRIQRLKKGGHTYRVQVEIGAARVGRSCSRALASVPVLRAFVTCSASLKSPERGHVQSCRGSWACSPRKILKFRPCESGSGAVGEYLSVLKYKLRRFIVLSFNSRNPFPLETAFVFEALPQNCLFNLGAADLSALCIQDMKQRFI